MDNISDPNASTDSDMNCRSSLIKAKQSVHNVEDELRQLPITTLEGYLGKDRKETIGEVKSH